MKFSTLLRVPLKPEPLAALRARYHLAVARVIDPLDVARGLVPAPSADAVHVFDTEDGLRLIVSLERMPDGRVGTHISASIHDEVAVRQDCTTGAELFMFIGRSWQAISGSMFLPELLGISDGGVPHFFLERGN